MLVGGSGSHFVHCNYLNIDNVRKLTKVGIDEMRIDKVTAGCDSKEDMAKIVFIVMYFSTQQ